MNIKIVIIEDHNEFRESIAYMLQSTEGFKCIGKYASVEEALDLMQEPDVVLLDINLPGISGIEGIEKIKAIFPKTNIIMLTVFDDNKNIFHSILSGADGYILKKTPPLRILQAIEDAAAGGSPMTASIAKQVLNLFKYHIPKNNGSINLTEREREILSLIVVGLSNDEISTKLFISQQTVRNHIRHIYEKLHVHSKSQAVAKAIKEGII
ncbi:MAG: response regulator transcription factor [Ignavibacteriales bacterium]|nr:response regulator transcription factor [Ignavibacteriales bacterium]